MFSFLLVNTLQCRRNLCISPVNWCKTVNIYHNYFLQCSTSLKPLSFWVLGLGGGGLFFVFLLAFVPISVCKIRIIHISEVLISSIHLDLLDVWCKWNNNDVWFRFQWFFVFIFLYCMYMYTCISTVEWYGLSRELKKSLGLWPDFGSYLLLIVCVYRPISTWNLFCL